MLQDESYQIYRITNNEGYDTMYERNRIFSVSALNSADGQYIISNFHKPELQEVSKVKLTETDGTCYKQIYHVYTRDYNSKSTKTYLFKTNDARDLLSQSAEIFTDNANVIERVDGMLILGALLTDNESDQILSFLGTIDQLRIIDGLYFSSANDQLRAYLCEVGQYYAEGNCNPCHEKCETCIDELETSCLSCYTGYYLYESSCIQYCPYEEQTEANENQTIIQTYSVPAQKSCITASSGCPTRFFVKQNESVCNYCGHYVTYCLTCTEEACLTCEDGYYPDSLNCLPCNENCETCSLLTVCTKCKINYYLTDEGECKENDPEEGCSERSYNQFGGISIGSIKQIKTLPFKDNKVLAVVTENDNVIRIWDMTTGSYLRELKGHTNAVSEIEFIEEFSYLVSSGLSYIFFWDIDRGEIVKRISFTNKQNYFIYHKEFQQLIVVQDLQNYEREIKVSYIDLNDLDKQPTAMITFIPSNKGSPYCALAYETNPEKISIAGEKFFVDINVYTNAISQSVQFGSNVIDMIYLQASASEIAVGLSDSTIQILKLSTLGMEKSKIFGEAIISLRDINNGKQWFLANFESGSIKILDYSDEITEVKIISTTTIDKGYFAMDTFSDYPYIAVSYNDNYDSQDQTKQNYLQAIRIINYETLEHVTDLNSWYQSKTTECTSSLTKEEAICFTSQIDQPQNISKITKFNMTTGYPSQVKFMDDVTNWEIADIIQKEDSTYLLCLQNRGVAYLSEELEIIKNFELEEIDETNVERCIYFPKTAHGNLLIQGYYESNTIGIYKETSTYNLEKLTSIEHFTLLGSFIQTKLQSSQFIVIKGIYTKESQPVLYNLDSDSYMRTLFTKPNNNLIGCTGIGWFSYGSSEYLMTMWRQPSSFEFYLTKAIVESNEQIRFSYPHYREISLQFYAGGGRMLQIGGTEYVLLNDGNYASKLLNVLNYEIVSNLGGNFGGSWVAFDDSDRNFADITWDKVPLYYLKEDEQTDEISIFITHIDEQQKKQKFGRIYGKGLDFTISYYTFCLSSNYEFEFNSVQESAAVSEQSIYNLNLRISQFEAINFGGCDINSFTIQVLFLSGNTCTISEYPKEFDPQNVTIQSERWQSISNLTLIIDIFDGKDYAIINELPYQLNIQDFTEVYIRNINFKWTDGSKQPNWQIRSQKQNTQLKMENITININLATQQQTQTMFYSNMITNSLKNIEITGAGKDDAQIFYNSSIIFEFQSDQSTIYIANFVITKCSFQNSIIFKVQPEQKQPQVYFEMQNFTANSVKFFNSSILLAIGLDSCIINNTIIESCEMQKHEMAQYLAMFEVDSLSLSMLYLQNNEINIDYMFKNYENENNMNPSFNLTDIVLSNNIISISNNGWLVNINIKIINQPHKASITSLVIQDNKFQNIEASIIKQYQFLIMFSSLTNIQMQEIYIKTGNSGLESLGIMSVITLNQTYLTLKNVELEEISNFLSSQNTDITISSLTIKNVISNTVSVSSQIDTAYIFILQDSPLNLNNSIFSQSSLFVIYSTNIQPVDIYIYDSQFEQINGNSESGSTLFLENTNFEIASSTFYKCSSTKGGALQLLDSDYEHLIANTKFNNNSASYYGGAIYSDGNSILLQDCVFFGNTAEQGGAIYFIGNSENQNILSLNQSIQFIENTAKIGGCVKYENLAPYVFDYEQLIFTNNTAQYYGSKFSSGYPAKIEFLFESIENNTEYEIANDSDSETIWKLSNVASGQKISFTLLFTLYDENEELIRNYTDSTLFMTLKYDLSEIDDSSQIYYWLSGDTTVKQDPETNQFMFSNLIFYGKQSETVTLSIQCPEIYYQSSGTGIQSIQLLNDYEYKNIQIHFRECIVGEIVLETSTSLMCKECEPGYYSIDQSINMCLKCPEYADCLGGTQIKVFSGYWRPSNESSAIVLCSTKLESCYSDDNNSTEQNNTSELTNGTNTTKSGRILQDNQIISTRLKYGNELCAKGFIGFKCEACDEYNTYWDSNYYKQAEGQCKVCSYDFQKIGLLILTGLVSFISMALSISTASDKSDSDKLHGVLMKMLLHHMQILVAIQSIGMVQKMLEIKEELNAQLDTPILLIKTVGAQVETSSASLDCFLIEWVSQEIFPFAKMSVALSMPFLMFLMFLLFYYVSRKIGIILDSKKRIKEANRYEILFEDFQEQEAFNKHAKCPQKKVAAKKNIFSSSQQDSEALNQEIIEDESLFIQRIHISEQLELEQAAFGVDIFKDKKKQKIKFEFLNEKDQKKQLQVNLKKKLADIKKYLESPKKFLDWNIIYSTIVYIVIFCQPSIVNQLLGLSFCKSIYLEEIDVTLKYISSNPSYECYTSLHLQYVLCMMVPALVLWTILIPIGLYLIMYKHKNQMGTKENNFKFGLMVEEYKKDKFYWELVKMAMKMIMQFILILYENNIGQKGVFIGFVLTVYLLGSFFMKPFNNNFFYQIDTKSTIIGFFSVQLALLAYNEDVYSAMLSYIGLLIINGIFFIYLIYYIAKNKIKQITETIKKVKKSLLQFTKSKENFQGNESVISVQSNQEGKINDVKKFNSQQQINSQEELINLYEIKILQELDQLKQVTGQIDLKSANKLNEKLKKICRDIDQNKFDHQIRTTECRLISKRKPQLNKLDIQESEEKVTEQTNLFFSCENNESKEFLGERKKSNFFLCRDKNKRKDFREEFEEENFDLPLINLKLDDSLDNQNLEEDCNESQLNENKFIQIIELKDLKKRSNLKQDRIGNEFECSEDNLQIIDLNCEEENKQSIKKQEQYQQKQEELIYEKSLLPYDQSLILASQSLFDIQMQIKLKEENFDELEIELFINGKDNKNQFSVGQIETFTNKFEINPKQNELTIGALSICELLKQMENQRNALNKDQLKIMDIESDKNKEEESDRILFYWAAGVEYLMSNETK